MENNKKDYEKLYFAQKEPDDVASYLLNKADQFFNEMETIGYLERLRISWSAYYGAYYDAFGESHKITFSGEQGELVQIALNHYRNIAQNIINLVSSQRPSLKARAVNSDYKSVVQAKLANGVLDYYMREKRLSVHLKKALEMAVVFGSGFLKMEWNGMLGEVYDTFEDDQGNQIEEREGDIEFSTFSPFDVIQDSSSENEDTDWILVRTFKNRHDIIAKYPEFADEILAAPAKTQIMDFTMSSGFFESDDLIPIYQFYHKKTESMPEGRYILFVSDSAVLFDGPLPYTDIPVYRVDYSVIMGTPYGYTNLFDLLPIQDALNSLHSTILTNQTAFGVQNIVVPQNANVSMSELSGSLNVIEMDMRMGSVQPLNLTSTPPEIFNYARELERQMETLSGINSTIRGNPEKNLRSANALALVQSNALQFLNGIQQSYIQLIEDVGTGLINMLKDFASAPRMAAIVGVNNRTELTEFRGEDLSNISRVVVEVGNPLANTTAGRAEMAEQLLQMKLIQTPEQYFTVLNTGSLEAMTQNTQNELDLIRKENESLTMGRTVIVTPIDEHEKHIKEHRAVLADPELRKDPELLTRVLNHIQEHMQALRTTDPDLLMIIREQPIAPLGGSPANQPQQNVPAGPIQQNPPSGDMMPVGPEMPVPPSGLPTPPPPFQNQPVTTRQE